MKSNYTKVLYDALKNNDKDLIEFLKYRNDIDWTYCDKKVIVIGMNHIIIPCLRSNDIYCLEKILNSNKKFNISFNNIIANCINNDLEFIKLLIDNKHKFDITSGGNTLLDCITTGLRFSCEINDSDKIDYFLKLGANPKNWWVIYHTTTKSNNKIYKKLMIDILKLQTLPKRNDVLEICEINKYKDITL